MFWNNVVIYLLWLVLIGYLSIWSRLLGYKKGYIWVDTFVILGLSKGRFLGRIDIYLSFLFVEIIVLKCKLNNILIWLYFN